MLTENLDVFFQTRHFGTAATYDGSTTINVIFDRAYLESIGVSSTNPVALVKSSDVATNPRGKSLVISGTTYTIQVRRPLDDGALSVLELAL